jgi:CRISPR-associated protein Csd1
MSALASLARAYDRMAERKEVPSFGYSTQNVGFLISLNADGTVASPPIDLRTGEGKKRAPVPMAVPQPAKRTSGIAPNFLWDKSAYVLGVIAGEVKRTAEEHAAFIARHEEWLAGTEDEGLKALLLFLRNWTPGQFASSAWPEEIKDQNIVFALERERLDQFNLHDRPEARERWSRMAAQGAGASAVCLITGLSAPVQRLHPSIKGVWGAQSAGASIISFNLDAFTSYGNEQGNNAPVSEAAAFAYTTALNRLLEKGSKQRLQIGDASAVFWADASDAAAAVNAQGMFAHLMGIVDETAEATRIGTILGQMRDGRQVASFKPDLPKGVRFHVLALAPNAARLSVRFYIEDDFGIIATRYLDHLERMRIEPPPKDDNPSIWRLLIETAVLRKSENIQPNLAGEWLRAILTGAPYPLTLLSALIMRMRADHDINALRVATLKSILIRNFGLTKEAPVSLDPTSIDQGYLLGRLFATYENVQRAALGTEVNATIKDKFYGSASAQPRKVFALLDRGSANHLSKVGKKRPGQKINLEKLIGEIMGMMSPDSDPFPASLPDKSQALFALGYYHQRSTFFAKTDKSEPEDAST